MFEYDGNGLATLSVPERATITNMGAELGATTSIFPADDVTRAFLTAQGREADFTALRAESGARYDDELEIDLGALEPLAACPHSPDNVRSVREIGKLAGQPDHHRQLHEFLAARHAARGRCAERQNRTP